MIFGGVGCVISNIRLDFDGDPLLNADQGISKGILFWRCGSGAIQGILLVTQKVADEFLRFFCVVKRLTLNILNEFGADRGTNWKPGIFNGIFTTAGYEQL